MNKKRPSAPKATRPPDTAATTTPQRHIAVIGAGMAGVVCARTLVQAGHRVSLFEKSRGFGGRMATRHTEFGDFDHGAQYFTVRDPRFVTLLKTVPALARPWSANTVRVLDELGHVLASAPPPSEAHFVGAPSMNTLVRHWAQPLNDGSLSADTLLETRVTHIERDALDATRWQLRTEGPADAQHVYGGFDQVVLALPNVQADSLLRASGLLPALREAMAHVTVAPCWTLMVAYPNAMQPGLSHLGPHWNAARSTHHRISWLARESSKPGRSPIERWTIQASPAWSAEHLEDDADRVKAKMLKGFAQITGIRAEPGHAVTHLWRYAQTQQPLGQPFLWDAEAGIGLCGDWCLGHRVENAFVSGLELALKVA